MLKRTDQTGSSPAEPAARPLPHLCAAAVLAVATALSAPALAQAQVPPQAGGTIGATPGSGLTEQPGGAAQGPVSPPAAPTASGGLRAIIAVKQKLQADIDALERVIEYQRELLGLARIDPQAARVARRSPEECLADIASPLLCSALKSTYGGEPR
ncbi:hypothetical protein [Ruegeria atlantica]|uniref:hypothetical protein n=1 Tax=Ruegeria atlantica TaxID=81569 RepID=UPI00147B4F94|nr:hypothetical protein [Ruegeria atlantica]